MISAAPLVSIIMPCYGMGVYVPAALASIERQAYSEWELIVVDDAGPEDGTRLWVEEFAQEHPDHRVVFFRHEKNRGVAAARNTALAAAEGELIAPLDPDDLFMPCRLSWQVDFLRHHPDVGVVGADAVVIDKFGRYLNRRFGVPASYADIWWQLPFRAPFCHSSVLMRRDLVSQVGGYNETLRSAEDYDLWRRLLPLTRFANLSESLVWYRMHGSNLSGAGGADRDCLDVMQACFFDRLGDELPMELLCCIRTGTFDGAGMRQAAAHLYLHLCDAAQIAPFLRKCERAAVVASTVTRLKELLGARAAVRFLMEQGCDLSSWRRPAFSGLVRHGVTHVVAAAARRLNPINPVRF